MNATHAADVERAVAACRPADVTPVEIDGDALDSTAPTYLRDLKDRLAAEGRQPATLAVDAGFGEAQSLATQSEIDRLRDYVRAAAFLGAGRLTLSVEAVADPETVRPALSALDERAAREGVDLSVEGDLDVDRETDLARSA